MDIQVNSNFKLTSDAYNVILNRKHIVDPTKSPRWPELKAKGASGGTQVKWREISYHPTVDSALTKLADLKLRESDATTLEDLRNEISDFRHEISGLLAG